VRGGDGESEHARERRCGACGSTIHRRPAAAAPPHRRPHRPPPRRCWRWRAAAAEVAKAGGSDRRCPARCRRCRNSTTCRRCPRSRDHHTAPRCCTRHCDIASHRPSSTPCDVNHGAGGRVSLCTHKYDMLVNRASSVGMVPVRSLLPRCLQNPLPGQHSPSFNATCRVEVDRKRTTVSSSSTAPRSSGWCP
jgi:hypothetical protein